MDYKYYFKIYWGPGRNMKAIQDSSVSDITIINCGSKADLEKIDPDTVNQWDMYDGEDNQDPQIWDRNPSDTKPTMILGRGNDLDVLWDELFSTIKRIF